MLSQLIKHEFQKIRIGSLWAKKSVAKWLQLLTQPCHSADISTYIVRKYY